MVPALRGQGIGRALLEAAIEAAREAGATGIDLNTGETDTAARALYASAGFTNREGEPGRPRDALLRARDLSGEVGELDAAGRVGEAGMEQVGEQLDAVDEARAGARVSGGGVDGEDALRRPAPRSARGARSPGRASPRRTSRRA